MKYIDQLDAVGRAAMEIGVEAGMQKVSDMFLAALAQEGFGEERLYRLACRVSELDTEFDGAYGCGPEADWLQERLDAILRKACGAHIHVLGFGKAENHVACAVGNEAALHTAVHDVLRFEGRKAHAKEHAALDGGRGIFIAHLEERFGDLLGERPEALLKLGVGKVCEVRAPFLIIVCPFHVGSS